MSRMRGAGLLGLRCHPSPWNGWRSQYLRQPRLGARRLYRARADQSRFCRWGAWGGSRGCAVFCRRRANFSPGDSYQHRTIYREHVPVPVCVRPALPGLPGRLDAKWSPQSNWDCVTGNAQLSIAWLRAYTIRKNTKYQSAARNAIEFIKRSQNLEHSNPGFRGGVKGSFPFDGLYGQYEFLNWAAKFFCDALLNINDKELAKKGICG